MIRIKVNLNTYLYQVIESSKIEIFLCDNSTIKDILNKLCELYGEKVKSYLFDKKYGTCNVFISLNKKQCTIDDSLKNNDEVSIFPPVAGG